MYFKELNVSKHYFDINSTERESLCQSTKIIEPVREKTNYLGYGQYDTNRAVQSQKMVLILKGEELYYPCSENKGADQLRSYCEVGLHLCFSVCRLLVFPCGGSRNKVTSMHYKNMPMQYTTIFTAAVEKKRRKISVEKC